MKQLPHATAEKSKPICKNEKTNPILIFPRAWDLGFGFWNLFVISDLVLSPRRSKAKPGGILSLGDCTPESHPNYRPVLFFNSFPGRFLVNLPAVF